MADDVDIDKVADDVMVGKEADDVMVGKVVDDVTVDKEADDQVAEGILIRGVAADGKASDTGIMVSLIHCFS